jgi:putative isomerase
MTTLSRRSVLRTFAIAGADTLVSSAQGQSSSFDLRPGPKPSSRPLLDYFRQTAPKLLRPAQGILQYPSIAPSLPGKQYSAELWDWDTLWTTRGLFRFATLIHDRDLHAKVAEHARGSLLNFFAHQSPEGRLPILMHTDNPDVWGSLNKATVYQNQAKPVMAQLALMISDETGSAEWFGPVFEGLLRFYNSWAVKNLSSSGLFVWGDDVCIGNDNDPTTFGRPFFSSANLLLNCLFYQDLLAAETLAKRLGRSEEKELAEKARQVGEAVQKHCWDPRDQFYYTADVQCVDRRAELIHGVAPGMSMSWSTLPLRIQVFTGFLPLWCGLATHEQASALVRRNYLADERFRGAFGVRSLSNQETMYSLAFSSNPSNWLGPVWIIVNYLVWKGLSRYGFSDAASDLANKTIRLLNTSLAKDGSLNEYYHPDTGAPLSHKGFMDWNLLALEMV